VVWVLSTSGFHRLLATKPGSSETSKAERRSGGDHNSIRDSWPIDSWLRIHEQNHFNKFGVDRRNVTFVTSWFGSSLGFQGRSPWLAFSGYADVEFVFGRSRMEIIFNFCSLL